MIATDWGYKVQVRKDKEAILTTRNIQEPAPQLRKKVGSKGSVVFYSDRAVFDAAFALSFVSPSTT